ncbi:APC family permease [Mesomycoplasma ovipneumoniae]|uniref:APC family permease n=1 Tax=Mesomycoplasma ovipneumoniae TaxID=29562 RepID=UPI0028ACC8EF|nr:APC family permease [Mesomycoplasma ovipneumoniae]MDW2914791.1 APC family permease [Mesomycoplasma ovipneumoniae]MDW2917875.1 APC family permease [Mesomycoplasma ovipneumoniae]MDW2920504.1 APC family permease [Mesomycoplasma ovipneumoniae]MDW2928092.1 APC family permease [Mesomycoplasma ovipneumoniae]
MMKTKSKNTLTERQFIFYGLNYVVGFGFIATISRVINQGIWGVFVFILTSLITLAVIFAFARAGQKYQNEVGGSYAYAKKTFKNGLVFFSGWNQVARIMLFSATSPLFFSTLLTQFDPDRQWVYVSISLVVYIILILAGSFGFKLSKQIILVTAIFKWATLLIGFGLIIYLIIQSNTYGHTFSQIEPFSVTLFASTILSFIYSYGGFESLATISQSVETKRFKKVIILMFLIVISSYFLFYIIFIGLGKEYLSNFGLEQVYKTLWGTTGVSLFTIGLFFNRMSATMGSVQPYARYIAPLAEDGFLPSIFAKKNKHNEYHHAIYLSVSLAITSSIIFTIIPRIAGVTDTFGTILKAGNISFLIQYFLTLFTVLIWKWRKSEQIPIWEIVIYIIGMVVILFTLIVSQLPFISSSSEEVTFEQFIPLISYVAAILIGYIVKFLNSWLKKRKLKKVVS